MCSSDLQLQVDEHFELDIARRRVRLTDAGEALLEHMAESAALPVAQPAPTAAEPSSLPAPGARAMRENVQRALAALWLHQRDEHYVVLDDKVQIVDAATGRVMPDRAWEQGLHQMIECKECVPVTGRRETLARITYQRLFRRYLRLSGMTGTAIEVAAEIGRTYGLAVARVPLHRPSQRRDLGVRCLADTTSKWQAVADAVEAMAVRQGRPVLIGTRTVKASEQVSAALQARDTVKRASSSGLTVDATVPRETIYLAQTPQAFTRRVLAEAIAAAAPGEIGRAHV